MILFFKGYIYISIHKQDIRNVYNRKPNLNPHRLRWHLGAIGPLFGRENPTFQCDHLACCRVSSASPVRDFSSGVSFYVSLFCVFCDGIGLSETGMKGPLFRVMVTEWMFTGWGAGSKGGYFLTWLLRPMTQSALGSQVPMQGLATPQIFSFYRIQHCELDFKVPFYFDGSCVFHMSASYWIFWSNCFLKNIYHV